MSKAKVDVLGPVEDLAIPVGHLMAAIECLDVKSEHPICRSIFLEGDGDKHLNIVATDGHKLFVHRFEVEDVLPAWLAKPVLIDGEGLKGKAKLLAAEGNRCFLRFRDNDGRGLLKTMSDTIAFGMPVIQGAKMPNYRADIERCCFDRGDGLDPVQVDTSNFKVVSTIAKLLEASLPDWMKQKDDVLGVRQYAGEPKAPIAYEFPRSPGTLLALVQCPLGDAKLSAQTAQVMEPAIRRTIAALRAHETRNRTWARAAKGETAKELREKADEYKARISDLLASVTPAIEAPKPAAKEPAKSTAAPSDEGAKVKPADPKANGTTAKGVVAAVAVAADEPPKPKPETTAKREAVKKAVEQHLGEGFVIVGIQEVEAGGAHEVTYRPKDKHTLASLTWPLASLDKKPGSSDPLAKASGQAKPKANVASMRKAGREMQRAATADAKAAAKKATAKPAAKKPAKRAPAKKRAAKPAAKKPANGAQPSG